MHATAAASRGWYRVVKAECVIASPTAPLILKNPRPPEFRGFGLTIHNFKGVLTRGLVLVVAGWAGVDPRGGIKSHGRLEDHPFSPTWWH